SGDFVEYQLVGRSECGFVELEVNIADDDGFFLDHNHLFNHWRRDWWWAAIGIDLHAFRRTRTLVAAVRHAVAVFVAITVNPAIGCGHTADCQRAIPRPCRTLGRAETCTDYTADCRTGRPVGFLQTCATSQHTG